MPRRRSDSVRFDTYWKVQWWDKTSLAWRDIQQAHATREAAQRAAAKHWEENGEPAVRLMRISENGRHPEPTKIMRVPDHIGRALTAEENGQ